MQKWPWARGWGGTASAMPSNKRLLWEEASFAAVYPNSSGLHSITKETRHLITVGIFPSGEKQLSKEFQDPFNNFIVVLGCLRVEDVVWIKEHNVVWIKIPQVARPRRSGRAGGKQEGAEGSPWYCCSAELRLRRRDGGVAQCALAGCRIGGTWRKPGCNWIDTEYRGGWCCGSTVCNLLDDWSSTHGKKRGSAVTLSGWEPAPVSLSEEKAQHLLRTWLWGTVVCVSWQTRVECGKQLGLSPFSLCEEWGLRGPGPSRQAEEGDDEEHLPLGPRAAWAAPTREPCAQGTAEAARDGWCKSWHWLPQFLLPNYPITSSTDPPFSSDCWGNPGQVFNRRLQWHVLLQQLLSVLGRSSGVMS